MIIVIKYFHTKKKKSIVRNLIPINKSKAHKATRLTLDYMLELVVRMIDLDSLKLIVFQYGVFI